MMSESHATRSESRTPWRRFWARYTDYAVFGILLSLGVGFVAPGVELNSLLSAILLAVAWVVPEAALISVAGTTPGKWLFGLEVRGEDGERLGFKNACSRSASVCMNGCALGIFPISLFTLLRSYRDLTESGLTRWDRFTGSKALVGQFRPIGGVIAVIAISLPMGMIEVSRWAERDARELTRSEIREITKWAETLVSDQGGKLKPASGVRFLSLMDREVARVPIRIEGRGSVVFAAGCDQDCVDLDLAVVDPEGAIIGRDAEVDAQPHVVINPELSGEYVLLVTMTDCAFEPCIAGYQVIESDITFAVTSTGTGFAIDSEGTILTAAHVVEGADQVTVEFSDGRKLAAKVVRRSPRNDLAALKVDARPPSFLPLSEQPPSLGQPIFTIGFPEIELLGAEPKFTEGTVTALSGSSDEASDLQVSIPVQSGNSGGPVVTHDGSVVGIVTSVMSDEAFVEDGGVPPQLVNFATRAELAKVLTSASATAAPTHGRSAAIERAKGAVVRIVAESD